MTNDQPLQLRAIKSERCAVSDWNACARSSESAATEMALHVLAYNLTRVLYIMGSKAILKATAS